MLSLVPLEMLLGSKRPNLGTKEGKGVELPP